jgi:hypothetical protein
MGGYALVKKGNESSNPDLSATQSGAQRNLSEFLRKLQKMGAISENRTGERFVLDAAAELCILFLWRAHEQSGFDDSIRRMQCDQKSMGWRRRLDFRC